jgi:hypothetical protein
VTPESDDSEAFVAESPSDGKKRKRAVSKKKTAEVETTSGEEEYIPFSKRVKSEPIEEMQMGFEERGEGEDVQEEVWGCEGRRIREWYIRVAMVRGGWCAVRNGMNRWMYECLNACTGNEMQKTCMDLLLEKACGS